MPAIFQFVSAGAAVALMVTAGYIARRLPADAPPDKVLAATILQAAYLVSGALLLGVSFLIAGLGGRWAPRPIATPRNTKALDFPRAFHGAGNGTRTRDFDLGKVALYQLSYSRSRRPAF